ncbi:MAG: VWA domain-containing protein [Bacillota bacterium]|nr:VWA domain-containing protein [Bacillota bacterium]
MEKYLENSLVTFVQILRTAGMIIGTSELLDALHAIKLVNMARKEELYTALSAVLVKSPMDLPVFTAIFQSYFVPQVERQEQIDDFRERKEEVEEAKEDLIFKEKPLDLSQEDIDTYASMPLSEREKIRQFIKMTNLGYNVTERHQEWLERSIRGALDYYRSHMGQASIMPIDTTGQEELDSILYEVSKNSDIQDLMTKNMRDISGDEVKEAVVLIRRLARRLATRIGRRYKRSSKREAVDVRRSIRNSLRYGGVLLDLAYQKRRLQKPSIIIFADKSGSMLKYSRFVIQLMLGLSEALPNMRCFAFSDHLAKVDLRNFDATDDSFGKIEGLGETTNLHASLLEFLEKYDKILNKRTVVLILSDTKTIEYDATAEKLRYISAKTKEIIWLNPMEQDSWKRYPMVEAFQPYVSMYEASSIEKLAQALKHI